MISWLRTQLELDNSGNTRFKSMEGLRGIAVFLVFIVHYSTTIQPYIVESSFTMRALEFGHRLGNIGVDMFFVLSGFLIYGSLLARSQPAKKYIKRRVTRIYPTFLAVFAIYLLLGVLFPEEINYPQGTVPTLLYIGQNLLLLPGIFNIEPIINVAWSLSYEVLYYILIPLLILALQMRKWSNSQRLGFWIFATLLGFGLFSVIGQHDRLMMFVSGILLYETIKFYDYKPPAWSGTISLLIAIVLVGSDYIQIAGIPTIITSVILFVLFYIVCFESLSRSNGSYKWLVYSPLRWLGNISYSYYLIHVLALKGVFLIAYKLWIPSHQFTSIFWYLWIPLFLITGMVSLALYLLVEKPISLRTDKPKTLKESMRRIS